MPTPYSLSLSPPAIALTVETTAVNGQFGVANADTVWLPRIGRSDAENWQPSYAITRSLSDTLDLSLTQTPAWLPAATVNDLLALSGVFSPQFNYKRSYTDKLELTDALGVLISLLMSEGLTLTESWTVVQGVVLTDLLSLSPRHSIQMAYAASVAEDILFSPALLAFYNLSYSDTLSFSPSFADWLVSSRAISETVSLDETWACSLLWNVVYDDTIEIEDTDDIQAIYGLAINEALRFGIMYVDPGGGLTTWAMNCRTGAVSEYTNYGFNSFAKMGDKYVGASSSGLYELDGDTDAGVPIVSRLAGGLLELSGSHFTSFQAAYIAVRGPGDWYLKLISGEGKTYLYRVKAHSLKTVRVNLGKGLRSRFFRWELESTGQDFDLAGLEFLPISSTRRV